MLFIFKGAFTTPVFCIKRLKVETILTLLVLSSAEKVKRDLDASFGAPWHVVVGEAYDFNIDYDFHYLYFLLYGPVAILAWRVSKLHLTDLLLF